MGFPDITKCKHKVRLTKLSDNPNKIRDSKIEGIAERLPKVGDFFEILARPRDIPDVMVARKEGRMYMGFRYANTSEIVKMIEETESKFVFRTLNSTYQVEVLTDTGK
jgi:hypothetical protein